MHMEDLKLQALISKYMEGGLPVPYNLLLPIWNFVLASFTGSYLISFIDQILPILFYL